MVFVLPIGGLYATYHLLEEPETTIDCKWLIIMIGFRPLRIGLLGPFPMAFSWLIKGGDPNYLLNGVILQVEAHLLNGL